MMGHDEFGSGPNPIVVLNDWMSDTSSWDGARPYLDGARFTWLFADLRGYGRSRRMAGAFTVEEGAADVLELADARGVAALRRDGPLDEHPRRAPPRAAHAGPD
jgi:3-oxoadipate enol-lactonase